MVKDREMTMTEARSGSVDTEEAYQFERLMGFTETYERPFLLFTWALD
jgi:hypothetical protein